MAALCLFSCAVGALGQEKSHYDGGTQRSLTSEEVFRKSSTSVFVVEALDEDGSVIAMGSGVAIQPTPLKIENGFQSFDDLDRFIDSLKSTVIVTNNHVIDVGVSFRVKQGDTTWPAEIDHINLHADLCRLRVKGLDTPGVQLRYLKNVAAGERAYSIGAPEGLELTISEGLVSGLRDLEGERVIQTSAALSHGSSGGGLFGADGRLIGITTFTFSRGQSLNFALPTDSLLEPSGLRDPDLIMWHTRRHTDRDKLTDENQKQTFDSDYKSASLAQKYISKIPDNWEWHFILGRHISHWDPHRAVIELEKAVHLEPNESEPHRELGIALGRVGDPYAAVQELREAVRLDPTDTWTEFTLLGHLISDDDMPSAIAETIRIAGLIAKGKSSFPVEYLARLPVWMVREGEDDSALAVCEIIETLKQATADGRGCLARAQREERQRLIRESQEEMHLEPNNASLHHVAGALMEKDGDTVAAMEEYRRACELDPKNPAYKADCERVLRGQGQGEPPTTKPPIP